MKPWLVKFVVPTNGVLCGVLIIAPSNDLACQAFKILYPYLRDEVFSIELAQNE